MWTIGRKIAAGFAIAFLLLLGIGTVAYRNLNVLSSTSLKVAQTHDVLYQIDMLLSELKDAETGQRGFVITGDEQYLEPYNNALASMPGSIGELRRLTATHPEQQKRLDQMEQVVTAKLDELKLVIDLRRRDADAAVKEVRTNRGRRFMDQARSIFSDMERDEHELLKQHAAEVEAAAGNGKLTIVIGTIVCLLFLLTTAILSNRKSGHGPQRPK